MCEEFVTCLRRLFLPVESTARFSGVNKAPRCGIGHNSRPQLYSGLRYDVIQRLLVVTRLTNFDNFHGYSDILLDKA